MSTTYRGPTPPPQDRAYEYSLAGDITRIIDSVRSQTYNYTYDRLHWLTSEIIDGGPDASEAVQLDFGLYVAEDGKPIHAVKSVSVNDGADKVYDYDLNGNMTDGFDLADAITAPVRTIAYNVDNMPYQIEHGANGTTDIVYDGNNKRAKKSAGGNDTLYINKLKFHRF